MPTPQPLYLVSGVPTDTMAMRLNVNQAPNDAVPYELQQYYSRDVWVARQRAIITKGSRVIKPRFDIIFATFMLLGTFALPIVIYYVALSALPKHIEHVTEANGRGFETDDRFWEARAASAGTLIGFVLLGWVPFYLWKMQARRQVNQMLQKFSAEDQAVAGPNARIPQWSMNMPGVGSKALHVMITYPRPPMMTPFQPGAALPPYLINQPIDSNVGGYYQQPYLPPPGAPPHFAGMGPGGVPLYNDHNEKIPDYTGPTSDAYLPHEKERFEDVRV